MELVKFSPEDQAKIDADKARPHCVAKLFAPLSLHDIFQDGVADLTEQAMLKIKTRAERAKMQILSTSISTNVIDLNGLPYCYVLILCQWAEIEKLEEMSRRAALTGGRR